MNLDEVIGNTAEDVLSRLDRIKSVIWIYKNFENPPPDIKEVFDLQIQALNEDRQNLDYWVMKDPKINEVYNRIQELLRL